MSSKEITTLRKELYKVAKLVTENGVQVTVNTKEGNFVMLSEDEYRGILETLFLSSDPSIKQSIIDGLKTPLEETIHEDKIKW
jgi:PHD/YefM family antitoxin component YafN of YafNO toxin-antitoxin module